MNYGHDPLWAHKEYMDPSARQAYENQVMIDRAANARHRHEADLAGIVAGGIALSVWLSTRDERKVAKAKSRYYRDHAPRDYSTRSNQYRQELEGLKAANHSRKVYLAKLDALLLKYADVVEFDAAYASIA